MIYYIVQMEFCNKKSDTQPTVGFETDAARAQYIEAVRWSSKSLGLAEFDDFCFRVWEREYSNPGEALADNVGIVNA